jgi:UDP-glucose 4-epimerase
MRLGASTVSSGTNLVMAELALVTGAAGFIGRHVCRAFAAQGVSVRGLGHGMSAVEASTWGLSEWLDASVSFDALSSILRRDIPDVVVHCAGSASVAYSYAEPYHDYERSVSTVATLLEHVRSAWQNKPRVVIASSGAVYGDQGDVDLTETSTCSPISPYGFNKRAGEDLSTCYSRFFGAKVSIVRLFSVYGEGLRKQLLWEAANKFARGDPSFFGTGHELRDWIHVEDAASLMCAAAFKPQARFEIFNGGNAQASTSEVLAKLGAGLGNTSLPFFTGETHSGNPRRLTTDCSHARRQLGWSPAVDLDSGLDRYSAWFNTLAGL